MNIILILHIRTPPQKRKKEKKKEFSNIYAYFVVLGTRLYHLYHYKKISQY